MLPSITSGGTPFEDSGGVEGELTCKVEMEVPIWVTVADGRVCSATSVVDPPEPTVIEDPGTRVCPATT